jgi:uncharacterized membrane protein
MDSNPKPEASMLPEPLHPAVVHFPIVLVVLLPLAALGALLAIRRGARPLLAWTVPVAFAAALAGSAWLAVETGEGQEERVEEVVPESALEPHEEAAEQFLLISAGMLALAALGLVPGPTARAVRLVALLAAVALPVAGWRVGHSGGELVYRHGAASAYTSDAGRLTVSGPAWEDEEEDDD